LTRGHAADRDPATAQGPARAPDQTARDRCSGRTRTDGLVRQYPRVRADRARPQLALRRAPRWSDDGSRSQHVVGS
jgi:hypothetical protein